MPVKSELTPKQKQFCLEYLIDLNATQAAIRAGYSKKTANIQASQNLTKLNIQAEIAKLKKNRAENTGVTAERVVKELERIGFYDINDFINDHGVSGFTHKNLKEVDGKVISSVETKRDSQGNITNKIEFHSKVKALHLLKDHTGGFGKNKEKDSGNIIVDKMLINISRMSPEELEMEEKRLDEVD